LKAKRQLTASPEPSRLSKFLCSRLTFCAGASYCAKPSKPVVMGVQKV
jgi:hypothetical protein